MTVEKAGNFSEWCCKISYVLGQIKANKTRFFLHNNVCSLQQRCLFHHIYCRGNVVGFNISSDCIIAWTIHEELPRVYLITSSNLIEWIQG